MAWYGVSIHVTKVVLVPKVKFMKTALCNAMCSYSKVTSSDII